VRANPSTRDCNLASSGFNALSAYIQINTIIIAAKIAPEIQK